MTDIDQLARIFKALSDPNRLRILQLIRERCSGRCSFDDAGQTVSEIASCVDVSLSTVSHHLKELRNAGLISCEKRGQCVVCTTDDEVLEAIQDFVGS